MQADSFAKAAVKAAGKGKLPADRKGCWQAELAAAVQTVTSTRTITTALMAQHKLAQLLDEACGYTTGMYLQVLPALQRS